MGDRQVTLNIMWLQQTVKSFWFMRIFIIKVNGFLNSGLVNMPGIICCITVPYHHGQGWSQTL